MNAEIRPFDALGRARIAQLINKTNQFNLTTLRRTEAEVEALEHGAAAMTMQVRLKDRFGDNGMICVVVCVPEGDAWLIDTWLMSCRVLNRQVEHAVLTVLAKEARRQGVPRLVGWYLPTPKNGLVRDHYGHLGFSAASTLGKVVEGATKWVLELNQFRQIGRAHV